MAHYLRSLPVALLLLALGLFIAIISFTLIWPALDMDEDADPAPVLAVDQPDLLFLMASMQRFGEKLYLAAEAGNWPLADLYAHELEEAAEELIEGGFEKNDVDLGDFARLNFLPALERVEAAVRAGDAAAFEPAYAALAASCNACHAASGYGLVRIIVPTDPTRPYPSQDFAPAPAVE